MSKLNLTVLCPDEMGKLDAELKKRGVTWGNLAQMADETSPNYAEPEQFGLTHKQGIDLYNAWQAVCNRFADVTHTQGRTLEVSLCYYDRELGDRYDEIEDDHFFSVEGAYQLTPAGQRFRDKLEEKLWTVFG